MSDMQGNVAIITGSSAGIGAAIAEHFASLGCQLTLTGRRQHALDVVKQKCVDKGLRQDQILTVTADLCKSCDLDQIISNTVDKFGHINYLINNAGVVVFKGIRLTTEDEFDTIINTNIKAAQFLCKKALPHLIKTKGNIVNISSAGSQEVAPQCITYCMSKAAMDLMTKCMAADFAVDGVRVNSVNPGIVKTPMVESANIDKMSRESVSQLNLVGRLADASEIARLVSYLCSDITGGFITGSCLLIDGGFQALKRPAKCMEEQVKLMLGHN